MHDSVSDPTSAGVIGIWRNHFLVGVGVLAVAVGVRGLGLAYLVQGAYPWRAFAFDVCAIWLLFAVIRSIEAGLLGSLRWIWGKERRGRQLFVRCARFTFLLLVMIPFLIVTLSVHPQRIACGETPAKFGLHYEEVELASTRIRLRGWYVPSRDDSGPVVLVAHGVGANKQGFLLPVLDLHALGYPVLIVDFRAHGDSGGLTTTFGLSEMQDVKAAHDWLAARHPGRRIHAVAYSMGGAAVAGAVHEFGIFDRIVLDSTFGDLQRVADHHYLRYFGPCAPLAWAQGRFWARFWTGVDFAENAPENYSFALRDKRILLIHGTADTVIPHSESVRLKQVLGDRAELWLIDDAKHIETMLDSQYAERLRRFLNE